MTGKLKSIQCLRAIAALLVLLCHLLAIEQATAQRPELLTSLWKNGAHGVDLFFVISGFVIVWVAADERPGWLSAARFLHARIARIYPLWWVCAGGIMVIFWVAYGVPWEAARLEQYGMEGGDHLVRSLLLLPQAHHPVLGVGWTLVHEMYFYVVFAILILCLPVKLRPIGISLWAVCILVGAWFGYAAPFGYDFTHLALYPMTLQFIIGAGVGYVIKAGYTRYAGACFVIGTLSFIAAYFDWDHVLIAAFNSDDRLPLVWRRTLLYGPPAAMMVYGAVAFELKHGLRGRLVNLFEKLGDWSYALYLCHSVIFAMLGRIIYRELGITNAWGVAAYLIIGFAAAVIGAALLHYLFERPTIAFFKRHRPRAPDKPKPARALPI